MKKANATIFIIIGIVLVLGYLFLYKSQNNTTSDKTPVLDPNIQTLGQFREECTTTNGKLLTIETETEPGIVSNACACSEGTTIYGKDNTFRGCEV